MFNEQEAKATLLKRINDRRPNEPPFEVTSIRVSDRGDYWIMSANVIDPYPKYAGVYGYLLHNESGEIVVCGADQYPDDYIQDQYDLQEAGDGHYVLSCGVEGSKSDLVKVKQVFGVTYRQARDLVRDRRQWFHGKKRHLLRVQELLAEVNVNTAIELVGKSRAYVEVKGVYMWQHEPIQDLHNELNITIKGSG